MRNVSSRFDLEARNFENLVYFYADRLVQVQRGRSVFELFNKREIGRLREYGILGYRRESRDMVLTIRAERARDFLAGLGFSLEALQRS